MIPPTTKNPRGHREYRRLREQVLAEELVCRDCRRKGRTKKAEEVDHILPVARRPDLVAVRSNLQALCKACHAQRTARQHLQIVHPASLTAKRRRKAKANRKRYLEIDIHGEVVLPQPRTIREHPAF